MIWDNSNRVGDGAIIVREIRNDFSFVSPLTIFKQFLEIPVYRIPR